MVTDSQDHLVNQGMQAVVVYLAAMELLDQMEMLEHKVLPVLLDQREI